MDLLGKYLSMLGYFVPNFSFTLSILFAFSTKIECINLCKILIKK